MAATATAKSTAPARRAPARAPAPSRSRRSRAADAARPAGKRRRRGQTPITGFVPVAAARTAGAVGGIADSGLFVWLTRGRLWIGLLGTLLVGIVGLNVIALSFSASSSEAGQQADALKRQNSALRAQVATQLSSEQVQAAAGKLGLVFAPAGSIRYLRTSPDDAARAARRLRDGDFGAPAYTPPPVAPVEGETVAPTTDPTTAVVDPAATTDPEVTDPAATTVTDETATAPVDPAVTATEAPAATAPVEAADEATAGGVGAP